MTDGIIKDGLWDVYNDMHMVSSHMHITQHISLKVAQGLCAEECSRKYGISREDQVTSALGSL